MDDHPPLFSRRLYIQHADESSSSSSSSSSSLALPDLPEEYAFLYSQPRPIQSSHYRPFSVYSTTAPTSLKLNHRRSRSSFLRPQSSYGSIYEMTIGNKDKGKRKDDDRPSSSIFKLSLRSKHHSSSSSESNRLGIPPARLMAKVEDETECRDQQARFIKKSLWIEKHGMQLLHPYQDEASYVFAYDGVLVQNDRHFSTLLQRLTPNGSPTFHDYGKNPPKTVLDIGCGDMSWVEAAATSWASHGTEVIGFDLVNVPEMVWRQDRRFRENMSFVQGNFLEYTLPFNDGAFDLVRMANLGLCIKFEKWNFVLKEARRVLKVGGRLEIIDDQLFFPYAPPPPAEDASRGPHRITSYFDIDDEELEDEYDDDEVDEDTVNPPVTSRPSRIFDFTHRKTRPPMQGIPLDVGEDDVDDIDDEYVDPDSSNTTIRPPSPAPPNHAAPPTRPVPPTPSVTPTHPAPPSRPVPPIPSARPICPVPATATPSAPPAGSAPSVPSTPPTRPAPPSRPAPPPPAFLTATQLPEIPPAPPDGGRVNHSHHPVVESIPETAEPPTIPRSQRWRNQADSSRELETIFTNMLKTSQEIHPRMHDIMIDVLSDVFGKDNSSKVRSMHIKLAPQAAADAYEKELELASNASSDSGYDTLISAAGSGKKAFITVDWGEREKKPEKVKDKDKDKEKKSEKKHTDVKSKGKQSMESDARSSEEHTALPEALSAKAAGQLGITYSALSAAAAAASSRRHPCPSIPTQSPGILVLPETYIPIPASELEMHACKHLHALLGAKAHLFDYMQNFRDEANNALIDPQEFENILWDYECFRRERFNWPGALPDHNESEAAPVTKRPIRLRSKSSASINSKWPYELGMYRPPPHEELVHIRSIRVFQAYKTEDNKLPPRLAR